MGVYSKNRAKDPPRQALRLALSPKGACDGLRDFVRGFRGRALFRIIKSRINFRISYLRQINLALKKSKFRQHFLFAISYFSRPPRRLNPWRPSPPFRGRAVGYGTAVGDFYFKNPPRQALRLALSPKGACVIPLRRFIQGACGWFRKIFGTQSTIKSRSDFLSPSA